MTENTDYNYNIDAYNFELPTELIAQRPIPDRQGSRLLIYNKLTDQITHDYFFNLDKYIPENAGLILNQSKVFSCRLKAQKKTGAKSEIFVLNLEEKNGAHQCLIKSGAKKKIGDEFLLPDNSSASILYINDDGTFEVQFALANKMKLSDYLDKHGLIPIPPYIRDGESDSQDKENYQTVFSKNIGSVAAPTAGLHFTDEVFTRLSNKNIRKNFVTLHVGMGTFQPVKSQNLLEHKMHFENYMIESQDLINLQKTKFKVAVGTTALRCYESALSNPSFIPDQYFSTNIFFHPENPPQNVNALITNFHLPKSTLLVLVASLIGREKALELYSIAIQEKYRFFSYGDAMLILL